MISSLRGVACEGRGRQRLSDADVGRGEAGVSVLHEEAAGVLQRLRATGTQECSGKKSHPSPLPPLPPPPSFPSCPHCFTSPLLPPPPTFPPFFRLLSFAVNLSSFWLLFLMQAVASTYFKRFYLNTSVMAYNPRDML